MSQAPRIQASTLFVLGFFFELALVGVAAILGLMLHGDPFPFEVRYDQEAFYWTVGATLPVCAVAWIVTSRFGQALPFLRRIYERVRDTLGVAIRALTGEQIVLLAAAAGMGEEVLFRGVLQPLPGVGIWWTSLLFGLLHAVTPGYFMLAAAMSLYLGWLQLETGNLLVPMSVHWLYDVVALFLLRRRFAVDPLWTARPPAGDSETQPHASEPEEDHDS